VRYDANPFPPEDADRHAIWEAAVRRDIDAFLAQDWAMCTEDFHAEHFMGIDARGETDPDRWELSYPTLEAYRDDWLRQAAEFASHRYRDDPREALFRATQLEAIEIRGRARSSTRSLTVRSPARTARSHPSSGRRSTACAGSMGGGS
jgi:hypothetical protein